MPVSSTRVRAWRCRLRSLRGACGGSVSAVQAGLEGLRLHSQNGARFLGRQPRISRSSTGTRYTTGRWVRASSRRARISLRITWSSASADQSAGSCGPRSGSSPVSRVKTRHLVRPAEPAAPQPRHRRVDVIRYIQEERAASPRNASIFGAFHEDVLGHLFGIFPVLQVTERKLVDSRSIRRREFGDGRGVPRCIRPMRFCSAC